MTLMALTAATTATAVATMAIATNPPLLHPRRHHRRRRQVKATSARVRYLHLKRSCPIVLKFVQKFHTTVVNQYLLELKV